MKILCLTQYCSLGASSRLRFFQYFRCLKGGGISLDTAPLLSDKYVDGLYSGVKRWDQVVSGYAQRFLRLKDIYDYDLVWLEKELFPRFPAWLEMGLFPQSIPLVVDYDDAVFHNYDMHASRIFRRLMGRKIDCVMNRADLVVAGNNYLAARARQSCSGRVEVIPTVVDTMRYHVVPRLESDVLTVGWIGSPATAHYLHLIAPAIHEVFSRASVRFVAVGAEPSQLIGIPIEARRWSEAQEVAQLQSFDIGIMPLPDAPFERGKCGYKLIQYMACGKPVVASPIGVNKEIVRNGIDGFWASSKDEWVGRLLQMIGDEALRFRMGRAARDRAVKAYSLDVAAPRLMDLLCSFSR